MTSYIAALILSAVAWFFEPPVPRQQLYAEHLPMNMVFAYAADNKIPSDGLDLLLDNFTPSDDDPTWELLKYLSVPAPDDTVRAYNFCMLNCIAEVADAALAEAFGDYLYDFILHNPDYTVNYLMSHPGLEASYDFLLGYSIACSDETGRTTAYSDSLIRAVSSNPYISRPHKIRFIANFLYWYYRCLLN